MRQPIGVLSCFFKGKKPALPDLTALRRPPHERQLRLGEREMTTAIIKPQWSPVTVALMVLGFVFFWPLGLAMLGYILWGEYFGGSADQAQRWMRKQKDWARSCRGRSSSFRTERHASGNAAFDEYRDEQMRRLDEERKRLDEEVHAFHEYMANLHKARDREEFDRFMRERNSRRDASGPTDGDDGTRQGF